jgi:hypothetical protein
MNMPLINPDPALKLPKKIPGKGNLSSPGIAFSGLQILTASVKSPKNADMSLRAKRGNLINH